MTEHRPPTLSRRRLLSGAGKAAAAGLLAPALAAPLLSRPAFAATGATAGGILKVGDQRSTIRSLLEASGQLKDIPCTLEFADFPAAPPMPSPCPTACRPGSSPPPAPIRWIPIPTAASTPTAIPTW
ncbi:hypothetical protein [Azospirillum sp. TSA6c]|uniref:hypothetical protein n=1 Tax=unclassified Azospirillum TaxID=2630922 RepID=UPI000D61619F|nr:hypothetical protein [Azospirillum sp. TSA6c]PWC47949.1 hypothetical protein TSA6c_15765 [Azospirillum sp. TSA6c]